jgi:hypothetical protein
MTESHRENLPALVTSLAIEKLDPERIAQSLSQSGQQGFNPFNFDQLRVPNGPAWSVPTDSGAKKVSETIDVIILHAHKVRVMYQKEYDARNPQQMPPDCVSYDAVEGRGNPGGECRKCPFFAFGSRCMPGYFMYVLFPQSRMPVKLNIPRTSTAAYERWVQMDLPFDSNGRYMSEIVTRIGLTERGKGKDGYVVTFKVQEILPDHLAAISRSYAAMIARSIVYPDTAEGGIDPTAGAIPVRVTRTGARTEVQVQYHNCSALCAGGVHMQEDAVGAARPVQVHLEEGTHAWVIDAFEAVGATLAPSRVAVATEEDDDDIPDFDAPPVR